MPSLQSAELHHQAPQYLLLRLSNNSNNNIKNTATTTIPVCSLPLQKSQDETHQDHLMNQNCIFPILLKQKSVKIIIPDVQQQNNNKKNQKDSKSLVGGFSSGSLNLYKLSSDIRCILDRELQRLLCVLFRKNCVLTHGAVYVSRVTKVFSESLRAVQLKLGNGGVSAVATLPSSQENTNNNDNNNKKKSIKNNFEEDANEVAVIRPFVLAQQQDDILGTSSSVVDNNDDEDEYGDDQENLKKRNKLKQSKQNKSSSSVSSLLQAGDSVSARVLHVNSDNGLVACAVTRGIVERAPINNKELEESFFSPQNKTQIHTGAVVQARILLHCNAEAGIDSHVAVGEIALDNQKNKNVKNDEEDENEDENDNSSSSATSVLVYIRLGPSSEAASLRQRFPPSSSSSSSSLVSVLLEFVPGPSMLEALPFCVGTRKDLVHPFLPLKPASASFPLLPALMVDSQKFNNNQSSNSSNQKNEGGDRQQIQSFFKPLIVNFQQCDPIYLDHQQQVQEESQEQRLLQQKRARKNRGAGGDDEEDDDDDLGEEDDGTGGGGEGKTNRLRRRQLEEAIDAFERQGEVMPTTVDGFKKLLLSAPQSSYVWIRYMSLLVGLSKVDEAKDVAEQALRTISVREASEKLNMWVAYLNLENSHGTAESLQSVFNRALQHSDNQLAVHERLAHIFRATRKKEQLLQLCRSMTSKFPTQCSVWELLCQSYIDQDKRDALRRTLRQIQAHPSLKVADKTLILQRVGVYEYRSGSPTHGRALFETLVSQRAKRSDVWNVFLDQELSMLSRSNLQAQQQQQAQKNNNNNNNSAVSSLVVGALTTVSDIRKLFQRASSVQLPPRAMQQLMQRFLKFEQQHGSNSDVERVKEAAQQYVAQRLAAASNVVNINQHSNNNQHNNNNDFGGGENEDGGENGTAGGATYSLLEDENFGNLNEDEE